MPRIALISDIHSNLPALEAVLRDIDANRVDHVYCLGDVVGYGPQPVECMQKVIEICAPDRVIAGNHDHAVVHEPIGFNDKARRAALWTNSVVKAGFFSFGGKRKRWNWLRTLPTKMVEGDVLYVHASPRDHLEEYLLEEYTRGISFLGEDPQKLLRENFDLIDHTCFVGHTHRPGVITGDDFAWHNLEQIQYRWTIDPRKTVINIGSVGQPRDGDSRASYVIFDGASVEWRRVTYDIAAVQAMIRAVAELDNSLAERLAIGR